MKSVLHGTCLWKGEHTPGSDAERECPLRNAAKRSERVKTAWETRRAAISSPSGHPGSTGVALPRAKGRGEPKDWKGLDGPIQVDL